MKNQTVTLKNVDVASFKSLFTRSLIVSGKALYFEITKDTISSFMSNDQDSFSKVWSTSSKGIFEHNNDFELLRFFFLDGKTFNDKILNFFGKSEWICTVTDSEREEDKDAVLSFKMIDGGLSFDLKTSNIHFATVLPKQEQARRFDIEGSQAKFELSPSTVKDIISLSDISEFSDDTTDHIEITGTGGVLKVSNNMFSKEIGTYEGSEFSEKLYKAFLGNIDKEEQTVFVCISDDPESRASRMVFQNKHAEIDSKSCAVLMTDIANDSYDIGDDDEIGW